MMMCRFFLLMLVAGCSNAEQSAEIDAPTFSLSGHLEDRRIREASGLARSQRSNDLLWVINDRGSKERVYAIRENGESLGNFEPRKAKNTDWEDLASFFYDDQPTLMIADIGDNDAKRKHRTLYFLTEPLPADDGEARVDWAVDYRYPDGPRDAESAAVDIDNGVALILSKRDLPPALYSVPLNPTPAQSSDDKPLLAKRLGNVTSLPSPTREELALAPKLKDWFWQPVGMDISADNRAAVVLTYRAIYLFQRLPQQSWLEALNTAPRRFSIGNLENAEAVAFSDPHGTVIVTGEKRNSPVIRIDLNGALGP